MDDRTVNDGPDERVPPRGGPDGQIPPKFFRRGALVVPGESQRIIHVGTADLTSRTLHEADLTSSARRVVFRSHANPCEGPRPRGRGKRGDESGQ